MAPKAVKTPSTQIDQPTINGQYEARFRKLFDTRFYKDQTQQDLWDVVLNAGLKAVEKRRKKTEDGKVEKAVAILEARGIQVAKAS